MSTHPAERSPAVLFRIAAVAGLAGVVAFMLLWDVLPPQATSADSPAPAGSHPQARATLGTLVGPDYRLVIVPGEIVTYDVFDHTGRLLRADLTRDELASAFPDLDLTRMYLEPPAAGRAGAGARSSERDAIMLAEPTPGW